MTFWPAKIAQDRARTVLIAEFRKGSVSKVKYGGKELQCGDGEKGPKTLKRAD
jgi:hypothetical protein